MPLGREKRYVDEHLAGRGRSHGMLDLYRYLHLFLLMHIADFEHDSGPKCPSSPIRCQ